MTGEAVKRGEREIERALGDSKSTDFPAKPVKSVARVGASDGKCPGEDLNLHALAGATTSR